jgi:carboxylesterase
MTAAAAQTNAKDTTVRFPGGKTGILLLHGLCGTPAEVRFVAMGLARAGYTVHTPSSPVTAPRTAAAGRTGT